MVARSRIPFVIILTLSSFAAPSAFGYPGTGCPEDLDGDGSIGLSDLATLMNSFGLSAGDPGFNPDADLDGDGSIGLNDLSILMASFGQTCPCEPEVTVISCSHPGCPVNHVPWIGYPLEACA